MASTSLSHQQIQEFNDCEPSTLFDVFINHRGPDVKQTLAAQFYESLPQLGIRAFLDCKEKELGNSFSSTIQRVIRFAKVHIAIVSKRYAESAWCLDELVLMLQSQAKIIPVFYQVKPSDLRFIETGACAEAFIKHKEKGRYLHKLNEWKEALRSLSLVAGEEFNSAWDFQKIVATVQKEVKKKTSLDVAEYGVELNNLVEEFEMRCLDELVKDFKNYCSREEGAHEAEVVGIFSIGGSGKTTLAKELFKRERWKYSRSSFLFHVQEKSVRSQLHKILKDLFGDGDRNFTSAEEGTRFLKDRLQRSPLSNFLIVLDDVDNVDQLNALLVKDFLEKSDYSLVIITTCDVGVLIKAGITFGYHLKGRDRNFGRELFCRHAFHQAHPCSRYEVLVESFVDMCGGLPLSLQVLGSHLYSRYYSFWEAELIKVAKMLHWDVKERLKVSFESLDDEEKQVFMDVACFFVGKPISVAKRVLEGSGWNAHHAVERLKNKCLLEREETLNPDDKELVLRMHDHLRDLGRDMALELSPPHRLWRSQDLKFVELMGFRNILAKTNIRCFHSIFNESIAFQVTFFLGQSNYHFESSGSVLWLELEGNSTKQPSIPSWIPIQNLQCLTIRHGCFRRLWQSDVQAPSHLKELHLHQTFVEELKINNVEEVMIKWKR